MLSGIVLVLPSPSHAALSVLHLATCSRSARVLHAYYLPTSAARRRHTASTCSTASLYCEEAHIIERGCKAVALVLKTKTICDFPPSMGKPILMKSPYTKLSQYPLCKACLSFPRCPFQRPLCRGLRRPRRRQHHFVDQHRGRGRCHCSYPEDICRKGGREEGRGPMIKGPAGGQYSGECCLPLRGTPSLLPRSLVPSLGRPKCVRVNSPLLSFFVGRRAEQSKASERVTHSALSAPSSQ